MGDVFPALYGEWTSFAYLCMGVLGAFEVMIGYELFTRVVADSTPAHHQRLRHNEQLKTQCFN
jgi:hypothetical protein